MESSLCPQCRARSKFTISCFNPCFNGILSVSIQYQGSPSHKSCFNPCFNGILSVSFQTDWPPPVSCRFNPCFNGILSVSPGLMSRLPPSHPVSILVLMESSLCHICLLISRISSQVSILVLMESSLCRTFFYRLARRVGVSILVLMESSLCPGSPRNNPCPSPFQSLF